MKSKASQGRRLIALLKRRACTYREMLNATESNSPWKRIDESLKPDEKIDKIVTREGWVAWRVVAPSKWSA